MIKNNNILLKTAKLLNISNLAMFMITKNKNLVRKETFLLMVDIEKSETFRSFTISNKALLFLIKLVKTAVHSEPKFFHGNCLKINLFSIFDHVTYKSIYPN